MVVYFRSSTTEARAEAVIDQTLYKDRWDGRGKESRYDFGSYLRLLPSQANGHEAFALTFQPTAPTGDIDAVRKAFSSTPEVLKIFENVAPDQIKPSDVPQDK
jgi:hypothetical protein